MLLCAVALFLTGSNNGLAYSFKCFVPCHVVCAGFYRSGKISQAAQSLCLWQAGAWWLRITADATAAVMLQQLA